MLNRLNLFVIIVTLSCVGCKREHAPPQSRATKTELPKITVKDGAKQLYTYFAGGKFVTVSSRGKVPEARRGWVRVVDLSIKPTRRRDHALVYVADLRKPGKGGAFTYAVMSRVAFELAARNRAGGVGDPPGKVKQRAAVVIYTTKWCGVCRRARAFLQKKGIAFVDKDIEKDPAAAAELLRKTKAAGISSSGVPVIDVRGTLMQGFNPQRLMKLLGKG